MISENKEYKEYNLNNYINSNNFYNYDDDTNKILSELIIMNMKLENYNFVDLLFNSINSDDLNYFIELKNASSEIILNLMKKRIWKDMDEKYKYRLIFILKFFILENEILNFDNFESEKFNKNNNEFYYDNKKISDKIPFIIHYFEDINEIIIIVLNGENKIKISNDVNFTILKMNLDNNLSDEKLIYKYPILKYKEKIFNFIKKFRTFTD